MKWAFDEVTIEKPGGGHNLLSAEEFWMLPLAERVKLIRDEKVQFICAGKVIPPLEALVKKADTGASG